MRAVIPELRALRSPDATQRQDAALALNAVLTRIGGYWGPDAASRRRRDRRIVVALVGALADDSAAVRAAAGWALSTGKTGRARGQPRGEAVGEVRALLRDRRADTRVWAAHVLGRWRDQASLPALRRLAARDPRPAVRAAAQEAVAGVRRAWISRKATARDQTGHGAVIISMAMTPDGRTIFTAGWDGTVRAWDVRTGRVTWVCAREDYRGEWSFIDGIALAPDGRTLAIATTWEGVVLFDVGRRRLRGRVGLGNVRGRLLKGITVGGDAIVFCGKSPKSSLGGGGWVRFLDGKGRTTRRLRTPTDVYNVAASPDGKLLAIRVRGWRVLDVAGGETLLELPEGTEHVTFSRDGSLLAVVYPGEGALWDLALATDRADVPPPNRAVPRSHRPLPAGVLTRRRPDRVRAERVRNGDWRVQVARARRGVDARGDLLAEWRPDRVRGRSARSDPPPGRDRPARRRARAFA